jgi:hypothetical protein
VSGVVGERPPVDGDKSIVAEFGSGEMAPLARSCCGWLCPWLALTSGRCDSPDARDKRDTRDARPDLDFAGLIIPSPIVSLIRFLPAAYDPIKSPIMSVRDEYAMLSVRSLPLPCPPRAPAVTGAGLCRLEPDSGGV